MTERKQFQHRIGFGVWINDFRTHPLERDNWPCVRIDQQIMDDFQSMMQFLKASGFTAVDIFGFLANHDWPEKVQEVITEDRKTIVRQLIDTAHEHDLPVIYGLGVYSWGFDSIIKNHPEVRGTSSQAMCGTKDESRRYMRTVIDYVGETFDFDGFHLEVADQGRCRCELCSREPDVVYFNRLNRETAEYIRSRWPGSFLLVNTSGYLPWGDTIPADQFPSVYELGEWIDVFIDGGNHGHFVAEEDRPEFVNHLPCDYGTSGGFWVYPPQRWKRLRWFLPYVQRAADHLVTLHRDGGRACELYLGPLVNPTAELNLWCIGNMLQDLQQNPTTVLEEAVETLYRPINGKTAAHLADLFISAESAFFDNWSSQRQSAIPEQYSDGIESLFAWSDTRRERAIPGELFLEPLFGNKPGFPAYLAVHMSPKGRKAYKQEMISIRNALAQIERHIRETEKIQRIRVCIDHVVQDLEAIGSIPSLFNNERRSPTDSRKQ